MTDSRNLRQRRAEERQARLFWSGIACLQAAGLLALLFAII